jgi:hypothetical protein
MSMHGRTTTVATFEDHASAERAIDRLRDAGYAADQIGFAGNDADGITTRLIEEHGNAAGQGALGGLVTGAAVGGTMAWIGLAAIPAIGPFLAGGAIGSALIGAAAGGATGGLLGGLLGLGIPRHDAELHEEQVRSGRTIVSIQGENIADAEALLTDAGAMDVKRYVVEPEPVAAGTTRTDDRR